jgi:uncharacterized protein (DUF58 family)
VDWKATAHTGVLQIREFAREQDRTVVICLDLDVGAAEAWLELAIECSAFLAFEFAARGARVRFVAQGIDVTAPETGDIYTILKYLALAVPVERRLKVSSRDKDFHIVFTRNPQQFLALEWHNHEGSNVRLLGPDFALDR